MTVEPQQRAHSPLITAGSFNQWYSLIGVTDQEKQHALRAKQTNHQQADFAKVARGYDS